MNVSQSNFAPRYQSPIQSGKMEKSDVAPKSFGDLLNEKTHPRGDSTICDFEEIKKKYGNGNVKPPNINDKPVALGDSFAKLTDKQIKALNERYDIRTIKKGSTEYNVLMGELYEMGVISNIPSTLPLNSQIMAYDENGRITEFFSKSEEEESDRNLHSQFMRIRSGAQQKYEGLLEFGWKGLDDELFMSSYKTHRTIETVLDRIFGNQSKIYA